MELLDYISDIFQNFVRIVKSVTFFDVLDILLLTVLIYYVIKLMRETRAMQLLKGVLILVAIFLVVQFCNLKAMSFLMENFLQVGIIAIIIVFQPELRRILEKVGRTRVSNLALSIEQSGKSDADALREHAIKEIVEACDSMSRSKTGALIVIERSVMLNDRIKENSTIVNADISSYLLCNIFFKNSPLHDAAVIIRNYRIYAAGCTLVMPERDSHLAKELGTRHRAAIGQSENSDALVIVVSEETGAISVALDGQLTHDVNTQSLTNILRGKMLGNTKTKRPKPAKAKEKGAE